MQRKRKSNSILLAVLFHLAAGCTIFPEAPNQPVRSYLFTLDSTADKWPSCASPHGVLVVSLPQEHGGTNTSGIAYLLRPHEIRYYAYNQWAENPARLLLPLMVQVMEKTNCWGTVTHAAAALRDDFRLDSEILQWQQEFFSNPSRVRLSFRAQLVESQKREVIAARRFEIIEEAPSGDAYGAVIA
ncbi:MAG TPA: ABC-type transport auxiliary lipoprotein family protein, partial [Candidatus Binatia bacterium]|nr:ABC-type transport auxiliary lipoprotein family protein [Candidatus Binatia bacterium]